MQEKPVLGITMGDPGSVGPEISVKALAHAGIYEQCRPLMIGDAKVMEQAVKTVGMEGNITIHPVHAVEEGLYTVGVIDVFDMNVVDMSRLAVGKVSEHSGEAAFQYVVYAIRLAMEGKVDAVITAPISKDSINMAGHHYSGHTEIFAEYTGTKDFAMLLASENLRVIHVTTHCALIEACRLIRKERVLTVIKLAELGCRMLGIDNPRIGVAGLNPHCSEDGLFGTEETSEIIPAVQEAKKLGINVEGPVPPDTVFVKCRAGLYDIVVAMYHDQGHIPLKLNAFQWDEEKKQYQSVRGINCTIGLPVIRVSVDHGTAFGKAGEGRANADSMLDAIETGLKMIENSVH